MYYSFYLVPFKGHVCISSFFLFAFRRDVHSYDIDGQLHALIGWVIFFEWMDGVGFCCAHSKT